tara:strand:- start:114 stop:311 length:198 start_codon:yes stop_codon:yes gene_type:complete
MISNTGLDMSSPWEQELAIEGGHLPTFAAPCCGCSTKKEITDGSMAPIARLSPKGLFQALLHRRI